MCSSNDGRLSCAVIITVMASMLLTSLLGLAGSAQAQAQQKPNIIFIMGDDIGWSNIGVYNQGIMAGRTPNLDRMASEGMRFTDYYAEASCTAGRANFTHLSDKYEKMRTPENGWTIEEAGMAQL